MATKLATLKRCVTWIMALVALVGVFLSYAGIYLLVTSIAAGLTMLPSVALLVSGPLGGVTAGVAWISPRQRIAATIGVIAFTAWLLLLVLMFTVLGFTFSG